MKFNLFKKNDNIPDLVVDEDTTPNFKYFFKLLFRKFSNIITLNLLMLFMVIPLAVIFFIWFFASKTYAPVSAIYPSLIGVANINATQTVSALLDINSAQVASNVIKIPGVIGIAVSALVLILTFGFQNVGATYILRELVTHKPVFVFSDYFYAIKKNKKQAFWFGIFDALIITVLSIDFVHYYLQNQTVFDSIMFFGTVALIIIYTLMRMYFYLMIVTFDLSFRKLLKNALIFAVIGFKRNIMFLLGSALLIAISVFFIIWLVPMGISLVIVLPFVYILGVLGFMSAYCAFPIIQRYMIDPYEKEQEE